jgi:hypothetical protein
MAFTVAASPLISAATARVVAPATAAAVVADAAAV